MLPRVHASVQKEQSLFDTTYNKTMKGLQFLGGGAQVVGGAALCIGTGGLGCAAGAVLIFHGGGNLAQSTGLTDDNFAAFAYIGAAEALGAENPEQIGRWSHLGVDLTGTAASALTKIPKPGAWKLFRWEPSDLQYSIQTPAGALGTMRDGVLAIDAASHMD